MNKTKHKTSARDRLKKQAYAEIDNEREPICEGCGGRPTGGHSHTLSVAQFPKYIADKDNIHIVCIDCHLKIEAFEWEGLNCEEHMQMYVEKVEPEYYRKLTNIKKRDQFLVIEDNRMFWSNNVNAPMFEASGDTIEIIRMEDRKLLIEGEFDKPNPAWVEHFLGMLKATDWDKLKKLKV